MYNDIKNFGKKITLIVTVLVAFSVISITLISFYINRQTVKEHFTQSVEQHNQVFQERTNEKIIEIQSKIKIIEAKKRLFTIPFIQLSNTINGQDSSKNKYAELTSYFKNEIFNGLKGQYEVEDIYLLNTTVPDPIIVFQYNSEKFSNTPNKFKSIDNASVNVHVKTPYVNPPIQESSVFYTYVSHPIYVEDVLFGMCLIKINLSKVTEKIQINNFSLDKSRIVNEVLKLEKKNVFKIYTSEDSTTSMYNTNEEVVYSSVIEKWMQVDNFKNDLDIKNRNQLNYWSYDRNLGVCFLTKVQVGYEEYNYGNFNYITLLIALSIIGISFIFSLFFARIISYPIIKLKKVLALMSKGVLPQKMNSPLKDELGDMIQTVNDIVHSLKDTAAFAQKIGQGEFQTDYKPLSKQDILGNSLVEMSKSLQSASKKDVVRNWIIEGLASLGDILRNHDNVQEISEEVIQFICHRVEALQGALFLIEENEREQTKIVLKATYAYGKHKNIKREFLLGEGIIGQCAVEKNMILRSEIPANYLLITSGLLGEHHPSNILVVPLIYNDKVYGVIELASISIFESDKTEFMEEVSAIISRTIFNINVNENTRLLLEQSQILGAELTEKKEQLEQNAQKMSKTQIEITETNEKLQEQIIKVREAQDRQTALLTNSDEIIFITNQIGLVSYVSPSITRILGYLEDDIIASREGKRIKEEYQKEYDQFFNDILISPKKEHKIQYEYYKKNGELVWVEAVGTNQLNNPSINGLVINVRDITIKKQAEEEQRRRSQMQSLSENSVDLIMRVGLNKEIFYVNPVIETYTGLSVDSMLSKKIDATFINTYVNNAYVNMLKEVEKTQSIVEMEADFIYQNRHEILSVRGIPEFNDNKKLETVLIISHNVTEAKINEREVHEKNKQIEDSIYYAENIQKVLLPDTNILQKYIPDSFVLFRPRDIVSGDFPWIKEHNGYLYIAAVDCTGHGVPGAMIATVGFFLLNSILATKETPNAAEVLNQLDSLLTDTFRQKDENSKLKDGMDMVMCRLKIGTNQLEIASANRPILHLNSQKELIEIKGNKFPIGGDGIYNKEEGFKNNIFKLEKNESIYFFSDGLQDQFDQTQKIKFGTKQIKSWIEDNCEKSAQEQHDDLALQLDKWKGASSQTDDILFIGLGF